MSAKKSRKNPHDARTIQILYVEDDPDVSDPMQPLLCATWTSRGKDWSSQSRHVRSLESAVELLEKEGFVPDLVLHDGRIYYSDSQRAASQQAGDALYLQLIAMELPILVISSDTVEGFLDREPYRSFPPSLGFLDKGAEVAEIREVIEKYFLEQLEK